MISTGNIITTIVGSSTTGGAGDGGAATAAQLSSPQHLFGDSQGFIYFSDYNIMKIRVMSLTTGLVTLFAGRGSGASTDETGPATSLGMNTPPTWAPTPQPSYYLSSLTRIDTVVGNGVAMSAGDGGFAPAASVSSPVGVWAFTDGNMYVVEYTTCVVRRVDTANIITTLIDSGPATSAGLWNPAGVWADTTDSVYIAEFLGCVVRKVSASLIITRVAGIGSSVYQGNGGPATSAGLKGPYQLYGDTLSRLYVADMPSSRLRVVDLISGIITTVAGTGYTFSGNTPGPATSVDMNGVAGVWGDRNGNLYISELYGNKIKRLDEQTGVLTTLVGSMAGAFSGDGGPPYTAQIMYPYNVFVDSVGSLFIADSFNLRVRKVFEFSPTAQPTVAPSIVPTSLVPTIAPSAIPTISSQPTSLDTGLVLYLPFSGDAQDMSGNGLTTTVVGATLTSNRFGAVNSACHFTSPSYISIASSSLLTLSISDFTISLWIKPSTLGSYRRLVSHGAYGNCATPGYVASLQDTNLRNQFICSDCSTSLAVQRSSTVFMVDTWYHVTAHDTSGNGLSVIATDATLTSDRFGNANEAYSFASVGASVVVLSNPLLNIGTSDFTISLWLMRSMTGSSSMRLFSHESSGQLLYQYICASPSCGTKPVGQGSVTLSLSQWYFVTLVVERAPSVAPTLSQSPTRSPTTISPSFSLRPSYYTSSLSVITTILGNGTALTFGTGGPASQATANFVSSVWTDSAGNVYFSENSGHVIRKIETGSNIVRLVIAVSPSVYPTARPSATPSVAPSASPSVIPSFAPSLTMPPSITPSPSPSVQLSDMYGILLYAGTGNSAVVDNRIQATSSVISSPRSIWFDVSGNGYISDCNGHRIRRLVGDTSMLYFAAGGSNRVKSFNLATGIVDAFAASGIVGSNGDGGLATSATLNAPRGVWLDASKNMYISENGGYNVRKVSSSDGLISTVIGLGTSNGAGDGGPGAYKVRVLTNGIITRFAGTGSPGFSDSTGAATSVPMNYLAQKIKKIDISGLMSTIAGTGATSSSATSTNGDGGPAILATFNSLFYIGVDSNSIVYLSDSGNNKVRKLYSMTPSIAPSVMPATSLSITPSVFPSASPSVQLSDMYGVSTFAGTGSLVRKVSASDGLVSTVIGVGATGAIGDGGPGTSARISSPEQLYGDSSGRMFIADRFFFKVRVWSNGIITRFAGTGSSASSDSTGAATSIPLLNPIGVYGTNDGVLFISDYTGNKIKKVDSSGQMSSIAGSGVASTDPTTPNGDGGPAISATFNAPFYIGVDSSVAVYLSDSGNNKVRKLYSMSPSVAPSLVPSVVPSTSPTLSPTQTPSCCPSIQPSWSLAPSCSPSASPSVQLSDMYGIILYAGTGSYIYDGNGVQATVASFKSPKWILSVIVGTGSLGSDGDGGLASSATINTPRSVWLDTSKNLFVGESGGFRVRRVGAVDSVISTVIGIGSTGTSGDGGSATSAALTIAEQFFLDSTGKLYVADRVKLRVLQGGVLTRVAGTGASATTDVTGPATSTALIHNTGVWATTDGTMFLADYSAQNMKKIDSNGLMSTIAGTGAICTGTTLLNGDGGPAIIAVFNFPFYLGMDSVGFIYLADSGNNKRTAFNNAELLSFNPGQFVHDSNCSPIRLAI
eukprot:gene24265-30585_t